MSGEQDVRVEDRRWAAGLSRLHSGWMEREVIDLEMPPSWQPGKLDWPRWRLSVPEVTHWSRIHWHIGRRLERAGQREGGGEQSRRTEGSDMVLFLDPMHADRRAQEAGQLSAAFYLDSNSYATCLVLSETGGATVGEAGSH